MLGESIEIVKAYTFCNICDKDKLLKITPIAEEYFVRQVKLRGAEVNLEIMRVYCVSLTRVNPLVAWYVWKERIYEQCGELALEKSLSEELRKIPIKDIEEFANECRAELGDRTNIFNFGLVEEEDFKLMCKTYLHFSTIGPQGLNYKCSKTIETFAHIIECNIISLSLYLGTLTRISKNNPSFKPLLNSLQEQKLENLKPTIIKLQGELRIYKEELEELQCK